MIPGAGWRPSKVSTTMKGVGPAQAELETKETTQTKPGLSPLSYFQLAEAAFQREDLETAEEHARKAVEWDPAHVDAAILLAWIRGLAPAPEAVEESLRALSQMLVDHPTNERALLYRAKLLLRANRSSEALADLDELLSINPHHSEAQAEVAVLRVTQLRR
jgi:Flp pilus assembly protein TadD